MNGRKGQPDNPATLPGCAAEFIRLVIRKMRYRKKVRAEVEVELAAHFEDALKDCPTDEQKQQKAERLIADFGDAWLLAVLARRAKKRCRPLWRTIAARTFQSIGVLFLCLILYCVYISLGRPTIAVNYVEQANRLARPTADESLNAAPLYQKAMELYVEPPVVARQATKWLMEELTLYDLIKDKDCSELSEEETASLKQWISANAEAISFFIEGSKKPHYWWRHQANGDSILKFLFSPALGHLRRPAKLTCWRAELKGRDGDISGAFDDLLACYRVGQHFKGPRGLVEQIVGIGIQRCTLESAFAILKNQQISSDLLRGFQARLEGLMAKDTYFMDFTLEKFSALDFIQRCYTDNRRGSGHLIPAQLEEHLPLLGQGPDPNKFFARGYFLTMALAGADRRQMTRAFEKAYNDAEIWAHKTPWQLHEEQINFRSLGFEQWPAAKKARYWPVSLFSLAFGSVSSMSYQVRAHTEALATTIALLRYRQDKAEYPADLNELIAAGYLRKSPMDPYSDKSLVYRRTDDGFTLYSVGPNFIDDGGKLGRDKGGKVWTWADDGDAVFWPVTQE
jgi:hypothetical protein